MRSRGEEILLDFLLDKQRTDSFGNEIEIYEKEEKYDPAVYNMNISSDNESACSTAASSGFVTRVPTPVGKVPPTPKKKSRIVSFGDDHPKGQLKTVHMIESYKTKPGVFYNHYALARPREHNIDNEIVEEYNHEILLTKKRSVSNNSQNKR